VAAGVESFAMTKGTAVCVLLCFIKPRLGNRYVRSRVAFKMTVGTVVMIQTDKAEELAVTATAMVVMVA